MPALALRRWIAHVDTDVCISAVTLSELQFGAALQARIDPVFAAELERWIDGLAVLQRVVPLEAEAARLMGRMQAVPDIKHLGSSPRFGADLGIAATAIVAGCPLATLNLRDFRLIAQHFPTLVVVDPLGSD